MMVRNGCLLAGAALLAAAVSLYAQGVGDTAKPAGRQAGAIASEIAGYLPKVVKQATYLVVADIEVPRNKIVTIEEGTVFLFKNFTSLHVQGTLVAKGSKERPIVFTSEYDKEYNEKSGQEANPFDWNGIYVHGDALSTRFLYCRVLYSVYGLISETKFIRIDPATFLYNGKSNLVIDTREQSESGGPGQYRYVLSTKDATVDGVLVTLLDDPLAKKRAAFRYGGLGLFLVGAGATVYQALGVNDNYDRLKYLSSTDVANLNENTSGEWKATRDYYRRDIYLTIPAALAGIAGAAGLYWSFTF